jgi:hypothetical protein
VVVPPPGRDAVPAVNNQEENMKAFKALNRLVDLFEDRGLEVVIADQDGAPLEQYPVKLARTAAYAYDDEVVWLEISERRMVGLVVPCDPKPRSILAD